MEKRLDFYQVDAAYIDYLLNFDSRVLNIKGIITPILERGAEQWLGKCLLCKVTALSNDILHRCNHAILFYLFQMN